MGESGTDKNMNALNSVKYAVYGLPEIKNHRLKIANAKIIANPGCYPTSSLLSLMPILDFLGEQRIIINATSGISGAGRNLNPDKLFAAGSDNYQAYAVANTDIIQKCWTRFIIINNKIDLLFVPHLSSIERGIYSTHYVTIENLNLDHLYQIYNEYYSDSEFIKIINQTYPKVGQVNHTNNCMISLFSSSDKNDSSNLIIMSAIDNLVKGASGTGCSKYEYNVWAQ